MFHYKLIELESEILAKEQSKKGFVELPPECSALMRYIEQEVGVCLCNPVPQNWHGWLSYKHNKQSLIICRGRAFRSGASGKIQAGLNIPNGLDSISEYRRGFDISPPQELDHLLINFGGEEFDASVYLWYGENIAPYRLIFQANINAEPHRELSEAIVEACIWILKRPKEKTLVQFLQEIAKE